MRFGTGALRRAPRAGDRFVFAAIAAVIVGHTGAAGAHDETVSTSDVRIDGSTLSWKIELGTQGLEKTVRFPAPLPDLDEGDLQAVKTEIAAVARRGLRVELDGAGVEPEIGALSPRYEPWIATGQPHIARVVLELTYRAPRPIDGVQAHVAFFSDLTTQHRAVVAVTWAGERRQFVKLGPSDLVLRRGQLHPTLLGTIGEFVGWGVHHIFIGYDHIAFLLGLLLVVGGLRELVVVVTSFTVAHSLTILLAALGVVSVPPALTEALIAASIVFVAGENIVRGGEAARHRFVLTFAFGLVHGLGFASVLRERLEDAAGGIVVPVVAFNLGVELGQLAIVALAYPLLLLARRSADEAARTRRRRLVARWGSVPIGVAGLVWLVARVAP